MAELEKTTTVTADVPEQTVALEPDDPPLPPTTTAQEDLVTEGQRRINLIWEYTQALVTIMITAAAIFAAIMEVKAEVLNFAFIAVISTYYARTNHTKIGGVSSVYKGR